MIKPEPLPPARPVVTDIIVTGTLDEKSLLALTASAERRSEHPAGKAVTAYAEQTGVACNDPERFTALPGYGVEAFTKSLHLLVGSRRLMEERKIDLQATFKTEVRLASEGKTLLFVAVDGKCEGFDCCSRHASPGITRSGTGADRDGT